MKKIIIVLAFGFVLATLAIAASAEVQLVVEHAQVQEGSHSRFSFVTVSKDSKGQEMDRLIHLPGVVNVTLGGVVSNPTRIETKQGVRGQAHGIVTSQNTQAYSDPYFSEQWYWHRNDESRTFTDYVGTSLILPAKGVSTPLRKPRIAIIDGSFHPTADINFVEGVNLSSMSNKPKGLDFYEEPGDELSHCGSHGNSVASIAGAYSDNAYGIAGVANADIVAVASLYCGLGGMPDVADGILWAAGGVPLEPDAISVPPISRPVDIINLSLGSPVDGGCQPWVQDAIDYAISKGIVVVAAVGNDRMSADEIVPASCEGVVAVGSIDQYRRPSDFTNYGSVVDIMAPGEQYPAMIKGDAVEQVSGTSFSSPIVSGVIAMALANNYDLDRDSIPALLSASANRMEDPDDFLMTMPGIATRNSGHCLEDCGAGSLNAKEFMQTLTNFSLSRRPYIRHAFHDADQSSQVASMLQEFDIESAFCDRYEVIFNDGKDVTNIWTEEMSGRVLVDDGEGESVVIESLQPRLTAVLDPQATYRYQTCDSEVCEEPNPIAIDESIPEACEELTAIAEIYSRA